jgi:AraC-like DNA-binding protein
MCFASSQSETTESYCSSGIPFLPIDCLILSNIDFFCAEKDSSQVRLSERSRNVQIAGKTSEDKDPQTELAAMRAELARKIAAHIAVEGPLATAVPGLSLSRRNAPSACYSAAYKPELVVFAQGEKRIAVGGAVHVCDGSNFLLTSVDLPVVSQITKASKNEPFLGLVVKLQMPVVREILSQQEFLSSQAAFGARGMAVGKTSIEMLRACCRLLDLLDTPRDIPFLGGVIQQEMIYRLLCGPLGPHLRAIATLGEQSNRTAKAVAWLKANFDKPLRVEELASVAQMGVSTFHHHFRTLTAMSPLQYQKRLRLHTARIRMMTDGMDAASAAFEVGYESPSQFNREYSRFFGQPPIRDIKAHWHTAAGTTGD